MLHGIKYKSNIQRRHEIRGGAKYVLRKVSVGV